MDYALKMEAANFFEILLTIFYITLIFLDTIIFMIMLLNILFKDIRRYKLTNPTK